METCNVLLWIVSLEHQTTEEGADFTCGHFDTYTIRHRSRQAVFSFVACDVSSDTPKIGCWQCSLGMSSGSTEYIHIDYLVLNLLVTETSSYLAMVPELRRGRICQNASQKLRGRSCVGTSFSTTYGYG